MSAGSAVTSGDSDAGTDAGLAAEARLRQLVEIESPTGHRAGIGACFDLVDSWVAPLLGRPGTRDVVDGVEHLSWRAPDDAGVLLLGHMDTVWPVGTLTRMPYTRDGERVSGPGTFDMKAGIVAAIGALELLRGSAVLDSVSVLLTGDEETGSLTSRPLIEAAALRSNAVLIGEPSLRGAVKVARRGASIYRLDVTGRAAHAGLDPEKGVSAIAELSHQVLALAALTEPALGTTVTPTVSRAGTTVNTVPEHAEVHVDVRAWSMAELERIDARIRGLVPVDPGARLTISGGINRPPLQRELAQGLYDLAREVADDLGHAPLEGTEVGGGSDGNFTAALGIPTLDGLGPLGDGAHAPHEWVHLGSVVERSQVLAGLITRLQASPSRDHSSILSEEEEDTK